MEQGGLSNILESEQLKKYSQDEVHHAINVMGNDGAKLIKASTQIASNKLFLIAIGSPTFEGHKYLDNIRDPEVWKQTKKATSKFVSVSIDVLSSVAASVITKMLGMG